MSVEPRFVDTNVLVYLFDGDAPDKQARNGIDSTRDWRLR